MAAVRRVQYFKGHTLDELKACTANDAGVWPDNKEGFLDSRAFMPERQLLMERTVIFGAGVRHVPEMTIQL